LATASIAQVHSATLHSGKEVVVKVIRPGIERTIDQDIAVMLFFALVLENYWVDGKRLHPVQVVRDYEKTIYDELDLQREAANASQIRRNFLDSELIYIPEIHWDYTNQHVLVMERVYGIPVADVDALRTAGVNLKALAERRRRVRNSIRWLIRGWPWSTTVSFSVALSEVLLMSLLCLAYYGGHVMTA
ncbi:AarF/UbiB family protein, partial [Oleiphilus sp. HI0086]|uniref:AarF/UbiB family protein n=1 Tax=Oleiphilus sp. HI0086 TaxID=1822260 RepID=UPI000AA55EDB